MRSLIVMAMFTVSLAHAGWSDYEEIRNLELDADGISQLTINAGAGSMDVTGVKGLDKINVKATIVVPGKDEDKAIRVIEKRIQLSLEESPHWNFSKHHNWTRLSRSLSGPGYWPCPTLQIW